MSNTLKFRENGTFKIMQITDIHGVAKKTPDTTRLIRGAIKKEKPDLVVFTGDQIKGYGLSYMTGDKNKKIEQAIKNYTEPLDKAGIPFLITFGNHDPQVGISTEEQMKLYRSFESCILPEEGYEYGPGTYSVPIKSSKSDETVFNLYMIDTGTNDSQYGYAPLEKEKIDWYRGIREKLREKCGKYIPSMIFQHIPIDEIYNIYDKVTKKDKDGVKAYRIHKGEYYKLKPEFAVGDAKLYEPSAVSDVNSGQFDAVKEKGDVIAMFFGHDHKNNFVGTYEGIDMGYGPSCGFNEYGNGVERGFRIIELNEEDPRNYETHVITYRQLFGRKISNPFQYGFYQYVPTSIDAAISLITKLVIGIGAVVAAIVLLIKYL